MSGYAVGHVLRSSRFSGTSLLVLIVIAEATHQDGTGAWPSVGSLARLARTTPRNVSRVLSLLEHAGELTVERNAGPRGTNLYAIPGVGQVRLGEDPGALPESGPKRRPTPDAHVTPDTLSGGQQMRVPLTTATGTPDNRDGTPDTAVSPEPSLEPSSDPSENLSRATRAPASEIPTKPLTLKQIEREQHAFGKAAEEVWAAAARKVESPYITRDHLRKVHELAIDATRFASEQQVLDAIRRRLDAKSSPVRIPEWARLEAADVDAREHRGRLAPKPDEIIDYGGRLDGLRPIGGATRHFLTAVKPV